LPFSVSALTKWRLAVSHSERYVEDVDVPFMEHAARIASHMVFREL